jgi:hypothetical protein
LREIALGVATLLRSIHHPNASIDYEYKIRNTFTEDVEDVLFTGSDKETIHLAEFLFHIIRLDGTHFTEIVQDECCERIGLDYVDRPFLTALRLAHKAIVAGIDDAAIDAGGILATLRERRMKFQHAQKELQGQYRNLGASRVKEFLAACPSNFVWSGYLDACAQALGDRGESQHLDFGRIGAGFSADALLMVAKQDELAQIVKLADEEKLRSERNNYRDFVRYKVPFAARVPFRGYAVDSSGAMGRKSEDADGPLLRPSEENGALFVSYGALVSDLVASGQPNRGDRRHKVETLLALVSRLCDQPGELRAIVLRAISYQFTVGVKLWKEVRHTDREEIMLSLAGNPFTDQNAVLRCYRLSRANGEKLFDVGNHRMWRALGREPERYARMVLEPFDYVRKFIGSRILPGQSEREQARLSEVRLECLDDLRDLIRRILVQSSRPIAVLDGWLATRLARLAIIHGDMNGRNLVWASAFERFFVIDFEHTGYGLWGVDQWRLVFSLIADSVYERLRDVKRNDSTRPAVVAKVCNELCQTIAFIDKVTDYFEYASTDQMAVLGGFANQEMYSGQGDWFLISVVGTIISSIIEGGDGERPDVLSDLSRLRESARNGEPWLLMARSAAAKEFEYTFRDITPSMIEGIANVFEKAVHREGGDAAYGQDASRAARMDPQSRQLAAGLQPLLLTLDEQGKADEDLLRVGSRFIIGACALLATLPGQFGTEHGGADRGSKSVSRGHARRGRRDPGEQSGQNPPSPRHTDRPGGRRGRGDSKPEPR